LGYYSGSLMSSSLNNKHVLYMLFMDGANGCILDVSLSEQETCAMLIMFMDVDVGWVLDVSLSKQEMCYMLSYFVPHD
jgi:hypothetical protein